MANKINTMQQWYQQEVGAWLLEHESIQLAVQLQKTRGDFLVQMGGTPDLLHCKSSAITQKIFLSSELNSNNICSISADAHELPLIPNSIDVIVLVHVFEFTKYPIKVLHELFYTLKPSGKLFILGFNPCSLLGIQKLFNDKKNIPWSGRFWSRAHVLRWLVNNDFKIKYSKTMAFGLLRHRLQSRKLKVFDEVLGQLLIPAGGGVFLIVAQKKVYAPIRKRLIWQRKRPLRRMVSTTR